MDQFRELAEALVRGIDHFALDGGPVTDNQTVATIASIIWVMTDGLKN
jgi:hypothetical protein